MYLGDKIYELHLLQMRIKMIVYDTRSFLARFTQET